MIECEASGKVGQVEVAERHSRGRAWQYHVPQITRHLMWIGAGNSAAYADQPNYC